MKFWWSSINLIAINPFKAARSFPAVAAALHNSLFDIRAHTHTIYVPTLYTFATHLLHVLRSQVQRKEKLSDLLEIRVLLMGCDDGKRRHRIPSSQQFASVYLLRLSCDATFYVNKKTPILCFDSLHFIICNGADWFRLYLYYVKQMIVYFIIIVCLPF